MAIVQLIKPSTQGSWTFATVKWNSGDEPTTSEVTLSAEGPGEVTVKGQSVQASMYRFVNGDEATVIAVGADSKILSVSLDGQPISMLPCATPACDQVIPETPQEAGSPVEVVVTFMEVMAKIKDVDSLDAIVDWNTVKTSMPGQENMQMVDLETFKTMMKDVIRNTAKDMRLGGRFR